MKVKAFEARTHVEAWNNSVLVEHDIGKKRSKISCTTSCCFGKTIFSGPGSERKQFSGN